MIRRFLLATLLAAPADAQTPPGAKWPGLVVDAGFFDERWQLPQ